MLIDTDVLDLIPYLRAVGFNVKSTLKVDVNFRDDRAIVAWARRHNRIVVCHDKYKDRETKIRVFQELYEHGGQTIQISTGSGQDPLTSLGKVLAHRNDWLKFFSQNDGAVLVHSNGWKPMPRKYLIRQIQGILGGKAITGEIPLKAPRRQRQRITKPIPITPEKPPLFDM